MKEKNQRLNRISSITNKSNNKEELDYNKVKHQEEIIKSNKEKMKDKLRLISENDIKLYLQE